MTKHRLHRSLRHNALGLLRRGGSGAAFDPLSLGAKLRGWWDFSDASTLYTDAGTTPVASDGDLIYQASDKGGNGRHMIQANAGYRPTYKVNIRNNHSVAQCVQPGAAIATSAYPWTGVDNFSMVVVCQQTDTSNVRRVAHSGGDITAGVSIATATNAGKKGLYVAGSYAHSAQDKDTEWHIYVMRRYGGVAKLFDGGGTEIVATSATPVEGGVFRLGANFPNSYIAEAYALEGDTPEDINNLGHYLAAKWDLAWTDISWTEGAGALHIQFDDAASGVYDNAYPRMAAHGIRGTVYVITGQIGAPGRMTAEQLQTLDSAGWAIASHTHTHPYLNTLTLAQQEAELSNAKNALDALGLTRASAHVAYPHGAYNADTLVACVNTGMVTGRLAGGVAGVVVPVTDVYEIPGLMLISSTNVSNLITTIANGYGAGQHMLVYTHDIQETPPHSYDGSIAQLEYLIDWIVENDIVCKTITELPLA